MAQLCTRSVTPPVLPSVNREGITGAHRFGSEGYAREELRAEIFSAFMAVKTGIPHDMTQHQAYVQSWADVLRKDKNEIFRAASEAEKAMNYVLQKEQELQIGQARESTVTKEQEVPRLTSSPA
ncbi:zincin-like metallopeptidase domain-containing protein [Ferrovum myxofaciens]|uniref:zincin-like metallopeptidase domain-containing protein n=1 Tax=Ferrovum myxofaciens TaxID=416213 RepID=UPI00235743D4|nr:zincin-like metallopeptidase domain-containing protein [Ferrovum myxofaciens]